MRKIIICLLTLYMLLVMTGCKTESSETQKTDSGVEYASVVEVTINPAFRLYLDEEQNVVEVESLNDDAKAVCENLSLSEKSFDEAFSEILVESVNQGFLTDDKTVNVEVVSSSADVYVPGIVQNTASIVNDINDAYNIKSECSVVIAEEIIEEQADTWNEEDVEVYVEMTEDPNVNDEPEEEVSDTNEGNVCEQCNGSGTVTCGTCNGSGSITRYEEHEIEVRNDYVCPYCGGAGILDDGMHGGETAICGHCGGGVSGQESGDFREKAYDKQIVSEAIEETCTECGGAGIVECSHCGGTGIAE